MEVRRELIIRTLAWAGAGIAGAAVLGVALLFTLDLAFALRHPIEEALSRAAGRQVVVNGEVRLSVSPDFALHLGNVSVAKEPSGTRPSLALARRITAHLAVKGFPRTQLIVRSVDADGVNINLDPSGSGMSLMPPGAIAASPDTIRVRRVPFRFVLKPQAIVATNVTVAVRAPWQVAAKVFSVDRLSAQSGGPLGAYLALVGHRGKDIWHADADLSSLKALITGAPFKVKGRASGLGARLAFAGTLALDARNASNITGIGEAADTQRLWRAAGGALPTPANFTFSLKNTKQLETLLAHFKHLGSGDLDVALEFSGPARDHIVGRIDAKALDLAALPRPSIPANGKNMFSTNPIAVTALAHSQVDLKLEAESANWREVPIGRLSFGVWADNGIVAVGPLLLEGPQTQVSGDATLDLREVPKLSLSLKGRLGNVGALLGADAGDSPETRLDVALELMGTGASVAQIMATSYGQTDVLIGPGGAGGALASALPSEIAYGLQKDHSLAPLPNADRPLGLKCLVSRFDISEGHAVSRALFVDTSAATTTGTGSIDFTNETLDFHLAPRPKDPDLIRSARDIDLRGTLRNPVFAPQEGAQKGLSRLAGETALAPTFDVIMPLLGPEAILANSCVRSLLSESALASLRQQQKAVAMGGRRAEAP